LKVPEEGVRQSHYCGDYYISNQMLSTCIRIKTRLWNHLI